MPRLPVLSGSDVVKVLDKMGFEQVRQRGSHVVMRRGPAGTVGPLHKELKLGTLAGILRQAGIDSESFLAVVERRL